MDPVAPFYIPARPYRDSKMTRLLLADDDVELCKLLTDYLAGQGFEVDAVHDGNTAVEQSDSGAYELMILDVMMPGLNGFDVLRELRQTSRAPVLMLTAKGDDVDRIVGLEMGADDYLAKPCNPRELVARIRAILRRSESSTREIGTATPPDVLKVGDVELRTGDRTVLRGNTTINLTSTEFNVFEALLRHAGQVVSKQTLTELALARPLTRYDRSVDMHVSHLRKKLGRGAGGASRIKTVRGIGYLYVRPTPELEPDEAR
ncbi:MAG: response regulator [Acidiferrobacterales bacterium]